MTLPDETLLVLIGVALAMSLLLTVAVVLLAWRLRRLRRAYRTALDPSRSEDLFEALRRHVIEVDGLRRDVGVVHANTERLRELVGQAVCKVGVVRYDAFEDMGGALSFSAALLDEHGTGVVVSAINGRSETRCYGKPVTDGESTHSLSREEQSAITAALEDRDEQVLVPTRRRRAS